MRGVCYEVFEYRRAARVRYIAGEGETKKTEDGGRGERDGEREKDEAEVVQ